MHVINKLILIITVSLILTTSLMVALMAALGLVLAYFWPYLGVWLLAMLAAFLLEKIGIYPGLLAGALGGLLHVSTEALTLEGVEFLPWVGHYRIQWLYGAHRKGHLTEFVIVSLLVLALLFWPLNPQNQQFLPFFLDWQALYQDGVIDAQEWRDNRFRWF